MSSESSLETANINARVALNTFIPATIEPLLRTAYHTPPNRFKKYAQSSVRVSVSGLVLSWNVLVGSSALNVSAQLSIGGVDILISDLIMT